MRVLFKKGEQRKFILKCCDGYNLPEFLELNKIIIPCSTFRKYYQERLTLPYDIFERLCKCSKIDRNSFNFKLLEDNWGLVKGGKKGIKTLSKNYKNELKEWRSKGGKNSISKILKIKEISIPALNEEVAELIGVYLGDGTLTKYFLRITGDKRYDFLYFKYLSKLIENNFDIKPTIRETKNKNLLYLEIGSKIFCDYINKKFKLGFGSKIRNKSIIPAEISNDDKLFFSCLRGMVDTDGSVSKDNNTLSVRFSNSNVFLLNQIKELNKKYRIFNFENNNQIGIKSKEGVINYFRLIGSSNLRHIVRFEEFIKGNLLLKEKVLNYYNTYKDVALPYYGLVVQRV